MDEGCNHIRKRASRDEVGCYCCNNLTLTMSSVITSSICCVRLKDLIKKYGTLNEVPKKRKASTILDVEDAESDKQKKINAKLEIMSTMLDILLNSFQNDYSAVAKILQEELKRGVKKSQGFGSKK